MLLALSHVTTACRVALTSGNFGFVRIPMLLLFMIPMMSSLTRDSSRGVRDSIGRVLLKSTNEHLSTHRINRVP